MKCKIPEISWHNRDPVLSVDIQPKNVENTTDTYRLASAGTDAHVLIWHLSLVADDADINLELAADLARHQRAVNAVKWSPNGELLASGDDESVIFIWKQRTETDPPNILENTTEGDKEVWLTLKILRGHMEDVYDLSWSPNSQFLVSGSVDNSAMIWDINKGKSTAILRDHKGFVQGVAWDPCNQYIATLSTDRYLRIFDIQTKRVMHRINKGSLKMPVGHQLHGQNMRLFHDDTLQTFFRRLTFTPDGKLLLTPAGVTDYEGCTKPLHTTYGFSRYSFRLPGLIFPCPDQYTVAVSCCPLLFALRPYDAAANPPVVPLPYRMIFAVATRSSVYFYDTQQQQPFAIISNIHYTRLTDITWSSDGRVVVVSSTDGFCSLITFKKGELGEEYEKMQEVLNAVCLVSDIGNKKPKRQKENDSQEPKSRKSSTDGASMKHLSKAQSLKATTTLKEITEVNEKLKEKVDMIQLDTDSTSNDDKNSVSGQTKETSPKKSSLAMVKPLLAAEIILDKEILSSDEKFESPEKKTRPVTPISVRRHPRTPTSAPATPSMVPSTTVLAKSILPVEALKNKASTDVQNTTPSGNLQKAAKPIAIRRTPRAIIPTPPPPAVDTPTVLEEAMDAWPTRLPESPPSNKEKSSPAKSTSKEENKSPSKTVGMPPAVNETTNDRTEDIRLVYEDTQEEAAQSSCIDDVKGLPLEPVQAELIEENKADVTEQSQRASEVSAAQCTPKQTNSGTPTQNKTPRRVPFTTISTPKSKKKLL